MNKINQKTPTIVGIIIGVILSIIIASTVSVYGAIPLWIILIFQAIILNKKPKYTQQAHILTFISHLWIRNLIIIASVILISFITYLSSLDGLESREIIGLGILSLIIGVFSLADIKNQA